MLYNKDKKYTLKYITNNGEQKQIEYTPEEDMSVPQIIGMLKTKDKDFFKLLKESKFDKISKEIFNKGKQDGMTKSDADAIAASIGRKKYGKEKFSKMAEKGKKTEDTEKDKVRFDGGELNVVESNLTPTEFDEYIQDIEDTFEGNTFISVPMSVSWYNDLQKVEIYSSDVNEPSKFVYYTEDYDTINDETTYTIYDGNELGESKEITEDKITTPSGEYTSDELKDKGAKVRQAFKDFWNNKISGKDLEDIKRQSKLSQGELDSIQYDASREVDNKMEAKNKDVKGIFDKKDVKSYLQDIGRVVANTIQQTAKNINIEIPTSGTLMSNNTVIQYVLPVSRFTGDLIGLGEEIGKNLKATLESGRVKDVKCVPEHRKNKQVLILSIIGPNIAKVIGESVDKELKHPELNNNIKDFYTSSFSGDDLGDNINNSVTFLQLYRALKNKKDIYKLLGTGDSTVRERVFRELARILNTDYMYVYNIWQSGVVDGQPNVIKEDKEKIGKVMNKMKKVEAENNNGTLSVDLNTGVLPVVDVDMYSMSDMINDYDVSQEELDEIVMDNAPEFVQDTVSDVLPGATIKATSVYHPQQYNFGGDELEFTLTCDRGSFETLKEQTVQNSSFASFLKKNYSSRSGFISSMADNIDDFNTQDEWKQVVQVIMFNVPENVIQYNNENFVDKFIDTLGTNYTLIDDEDNLDESVEYMSKADFDKLPKDYKTTVGDIIKTSAFRGEDPEVVRKKYKDLGYDETDSMVMTNDGKGGTVLKPVKIQEDSSESDNVDVVSYNVTNGGYDNNEETMYGKLSDGNYFVYMPEADTVEIYDCEPSELIDILYADREEVSDEERTKAYNDFFEQHNVDTLMSGKLLDKINKLYFGNDEDDEDDLFESKTTENSEADKLIKDYFNYKMDLPTLHKKLRQLFGNMKDAVEYLHDNETRVKNMKESKLQEDDEEEMEDVDSEGEGEDTTQTQENIEQAVQNLGGITEEEKFSIDTIASTVNVLITDEQSAIDGYNSFLKQCEDTLPEELYDTIKNEIDEIIQDEEDHINKLTVIKEALNIEDTSEKVTESNSDKSEFKYKVGDMVLYKGKKYKITDTISGHTWEGQTAEDEEDEVDKFDTHTFTEHTDAHYEIQNPDDETDWGYVEAKTLESQSKLIK